MRHHPTEIVALRRQSWKLIHEVSGYVISERLRQLNTMLAKYSPTQPRVPAGSSDGGQWTSGGGGGGIVADRPEDTGYGIEEFPRPKPASSPLGGIVPEFGRENDVRTPPIVGISRPAGAGVGTQPIFQGQGPNSPARVNPQAALGTLIGQGVGVIANAIGDVFGSFKAMVQDAFGEFSTPFEVPSIVGPNGEKLVPEQVNIFIGGADDESGDFGGNHPVRNSHALSRDVHGYNIYTTHDQGDKISAAVQQLPPNVQVNVIGHSYGGDTAADVALANPGRISVLVTVDPVSWSRPEFSDVRSSVGAWVNTRAVGKEDASDRLARFGYRWGDEPKPYADMYVEVPRNHADFDATVGYRFSGGVSINNLLNRGR